MKPGLMTRAHESMTIGERLERLLQLAATAEAVAVVNTSDEGAIGSDPNDLLEILAGIASEIHDHVFVIETALTETQRKARAWTEDAIREERRSAALRAHARGRS